MGRRQRSWPAAPPGGLPSRAGRSGGRDFGGGGMKRLLTCVAVALGMLTAASGVAVAKSNPRATAKSAGDQFIAAYLPSAPGQPGICDVPGQSGFFNKNNTYFASCSATANGDLLQIYAFVNAKKGASVAVNVPYVAAQLNLVCNGGGGSSYAAGVKGKFVELFAANGGYVSIAKGLRDQVAGTVKNTPGHVSVDQPC
jgi:hypothetical protein